MTPEKKENHLSALAFPLNREPVALNVSMISCIYPTHPAVVEGLKKSLAEHGMLYPLVVVPTMLFNHRLPYYIENHHVENPGAPYFVYTGNNRLHVAREMGYTSVDVYICRDLSVLTEWEEKMRLNVRDYP